MRLQGVALDDQGVSALPASTGTGKTALGGQIALHVAQHSGPVLFVSMELTGVELGYAWWPC